MKVKLIGFFLAISLLSNAQTKIMFSQSSGKLNSGETPDLMIYDTKSKKTKLLLKGAVKGRGVYNAVTTGDSSKILFNTYRYSGWKLAIADFNSDKISNIKRFTKRNNYEYNGKFSPDGKKVVYQEYNWSTQSSELFISNNDGSNPKLFFENNISDQNLDWTKDGKSIVFTHNKNSKLALYLKSIDGETFKRINTSESNDFAPSISKTTGQIAFFSDRNDKVDVFVMDLDGKNIKNLTESLNNKDVVVDNIWAYKISWSPCGDQLVFNAMTKDGVELFIVNVDGTNLHRITNNNDSEITPFWTGNCLDEE